MLIDLLLSLLDERQDIAHAQDPVGHPVRVEDVEVIKLFTSGDVENRLPCDLTDGEGCTASSVAVKLGEDDASEVNAFPERVGGMDRVLTDHRVDYEENFVGVRGIANISRLLHKDFINTESTGRIDDDNVVFRALRFFNTSGRDANRVAV